MVRVSGEGNVLVLQVRVRATENSGDVRALRFRKVGDLVQRGAA
jgi:hypothetical protein